jgi:amino acid permease
MSKVITHGSLYAAFLYLLIGVFGYLTFVNTPDVLLGQNILNAPYNKHMAIMIVRK